MTDILMIPSSDYLYTYEYTTYKYTNWRSYDRKRKKTAASEHIIWK